VGNHCYVYKCTRVRGPKVVREVVDSLILILPSIFYHVSLNLGSSQASGGRSHAPLGIMDTNGKVESTVVGSFVR